MFLILYKARVEAEFGFEIFFGLEGDRFGDTQVMNFGGVFWPQSGHLR